MTPPAKSMLNRLRKRPPAARIFQRWLRTLSLPGRLRDNY